MLVVEWQGARGKRVKLLITATNLSDNNGVKVRGVRSANKQETCATSGHGSAGDWRIHCWSNLSSISCYNNAIAVAAVVAAGRVFWKQHYRPPTTPDDEEMDGLLVPPATTNDYELILVKLHFPLPIWSLLVILTSDLVSSCRSRSFSDQKPWADV